MPSEASECWEKVRRAKQKLVDRFLDHPDVSLIDIGYAPEPDNKTDEMVLRIHLRESHKKIVPAEGCDFPELVDGFHVIVIPGDYRLDNEDPGVGE